MNHKNFPPNFKNGKKNIAIDFDGVIHNSSKGWHDGTCYGSPIKEAINSIKKLSKKYNIIIFTAKCKNDRPLINGKTGYQLVKEWLVKNNLIDYIKEITSEKPRALIYIDDNAYRFMNWEKTMIDLEEKYL